MNTVGFPFQFILKDYYCNALLVFFWKPKKLLTNMMILPGCGLVKGPSLAWVTPKQRNTRMLATMPLHNHKYQQKSL